MDANRFDQFSRVFATIDTRRGLARLLLGVPFLAGVVRLVDTPGRVRAADDDHGSSHRRRRRKTRHKHRKNTVRRNKKHKPNTRKAACVPESVAQTCAGKCAMVANNCGVPVDCGPCVCGRCPVCFTCNPATGDCMPNPAVVRQPCGTPGQVCQPLTGACTCDAGSCASGQRCDGTSCICDGTSCGTGCCDGTTCHIDDDAACGISGGACQNCVILDQICGGGGTPGLCGCESDAEACGAQTCGTVVNNCGQTRTCSGCAGCCNGNTCVAIGSQSHGQCGTGTPGAPCGSCATCQSCSGGQCQGDATDCATGCCAGTTCMPGNAPTQCGHVGQVCFDCGETQACVGDICECRPTGISCCVSAGNVPVGVVTNCSICCSGACNTPGVPSSGCAP